LRIEGSVPHGIQRFEAGDTVAGVSFLLILNGSPRGDISPDALLNVPVDACDNQVSDTATLGTGVVLGIGVIIEDFATIGNNVVLGNQVFVGRNAVIGNDTVFGNGAQIARDVIVGDRVQGLTVINTIFHPVVIDKGATVGNDTILEATEIGAGAIVGSNVMALSRVDPVTHEISVVTIGKKATFGDDSTLDFGTVVGRGAVLGDGVGTTSVLNGIWNPVIFDKGVTVGADSKFLGHTEVEMKASIGIGTTVGKNVVIGKRAVVGDLVTIADGVIVPKGAVVPDFATLPLP